jgi:hypothetical protein
MPQFEPRRRDRFDARRARAAVEVRICLPLG